MSTRLPWRCEITSHFSSHYKPDSLTLGVTRQCQPTGQDEVNMAKQYLRFNDLKAREIVRNRTTLARWIKKYGFPPGVLLGPNTRAWPADEVDAWLNAREAA